jgi:hypothetical protein
VSQYTQEKRSIAKEIKKGKTKEKSGEKNEKETK